MINFFAKRWKELSEETKDTNVPVPTVAGGGNERILASILELTDHIDRINYG